MNVSYVIQAPGFFATRSGRYAANLIATIESAARTARSTEDRDAKIRVATTEIANTKDESSKAFTKALNELYTKNTGKSSPFANSAQFVDYVEQVEKSRDKAKFIKGIGESGKVVLETLSTHNNYRRSRSAITDLLRAFPEQPASAPAKNPGYQPHPFQNEAKRRAGSFDTEAEIRDVQNGFGMAYPVGEGYQPANQTAETTYGLRTDTQAMLDEHRNRMRENEAARAQNRRTRAEDEMGRKVKQGIQIEEVRNDQYDYQDRITDLNQRAIANRIFAGKLGHEAKITQEYREAELNAAHNLAETEAEMFEAAGGFIRK